MIKFYQNYSTRWSFDRYGCIFSGFVMYFVGIASIYIMVAISIERYYITRNPLNMRELNSRIVYRIIYFCLLITFLWASLPLFGWSYYSLEGGLTSCSIEWNDRSLNVISYNVITFVAFYIVPLCIISYTNFHLLIMVYFSLSL
jgi:hypothetical protein